MPTKKHEPASEIEAAPPGVVRNSPKPERKTKRALLLELISKVGGATLEELTSATGWLPHTIRAAITGLRKQGHDVKCQRVDGVSRYTVGTSRQ